MDDELEYTKCTFQDSILNEYHKLHPPISEVRDEKKVSRNDEVDEFDKLMDNEMWLKFIYTKFLHHLSTQ